MNTQNSHNDPAHIDSAHYEAGTLRAFLDHEAPEHDTIAAHVRDCLACRRQLRDVRADALAAEHALALLGDGDQLAAPQSAFARDLAPIDPPVKRRYTGWIAAAALVVAGSLVVGTPAGRSMAADALNVFRSTSVKPFEVTSTDAATTVGTLAMLTRDPDQLVARLDDLYPNEVTSVAAAQSKVDFTIPTVDGLPDDSGAPEQVLVTQGRQVTVVFDAERTKQYLHEMSSDLAVPAGFDGTKLVVDFPDAVAQRFDARNGRTVVVGTAQAISARTAEGMDLNQLLGFLTQLPGIPSNVVDQLRGTDLGAGALPIPVPMDIVQSQETEVDGHDGVEVSQPGLGGGVLWQDGDLIYGVAGSYDSDTIHSIAEGLVD